MKPLKLNSSKFNKRGGWKNQAGRGEGGCKILENLIAGER